MSTTLKGKYHGHIVKNTEKQSGSSPAYDRRTRVDFKVFSEPN